MVQLQYALEPAGYARKHPTTLRDSLLLPCLPVSPRRCSFPITALRVTLPPSFSTTVRAVSLASQSRLSNSVCGSFH